MKKLGRVVPSRIAFLSSHGMAPFILAWAMSSAALGAPVKVEPRASDELLANPGMGWQTFHHFADEDKNLQNLPSGSAYFRFYWREIEPENGRIDFAKFDALLDHARRAGQKLCFRVMCTGSSQYMDVPSWLKEQGCAGVEFVFGGRKHWAPDFADPLFQETHFRLIRELGRRYDTHPDLDLVDMGSVGLWGEWHMSSTEVLGTGQPVALPSLELRRKIIDAYREAFPNSSKVILIGSDEGMARAATNGYGWRADCLGDMGGFSKNWNHMDHFYLQQLKKTGAVDVWKTAPVAWESCWDMRKWTEEKWDIRGIFDYGLACHASYMNNKSAPIPEGTRAEVERFLQRLGYRLVVRSLTHERVWKPGGAVTVRMEWENLGVAPPYRHYPLALRLKSAAAPADPATVFVTEKSIRGWLPGKHTVELPLSVPPLSAGRYELAVGVVHPVTKEPEVRLAIEGRDAAGWYPLSTVDLAD